MRTITGSCGFLALFQREMAAAVDIPVFSSSLIQVPLAYHMTGGSAPVGILTADKTALSSAHLKAVGAEGIPVVIQGLEKTSEFAQVILRNERTSMDLNLIETEVLNAALKLKREAPAIRSLVLECTDIPPYAARLQKELKLPIFDLTTLATMAHDVVARKEFQGLMPF